MPEPFQSVPPGTSSFSPAQPQLAVAHYNAGNTLLQQGKPQEALAGYQQALHFQPDFVEAHYNRAEAWLVLGDFGQGWPEYEWRFRFKDETPRSFRQPLWDGSPLAGRTILLYAEQGL